MNGAGIKITITNSPNFVEALRVIDSYKATNITHEQLADDLFEPLMGMLEQRTETLTPDEACWQVLGQFKLTLNATDTSNTDRILFVISDVLSDLNPREPAESVL
jgi:hypothetical protein